MSQNYGKRLYQLAISAPEVDIFNEEQVEVYVRQKAVELCLDPDDMVEAAMRYDATLDDIEQATERC